jgi:hypothetical protein
MNSTDAASVQVGDVVTGQGVSSNITVSAIENTTDANFKLIKVSSGIPASNVNPLTLTFTRPNASISGTQTVTITPNAGYVVSASAFNSGNNIADNANISNASFADTGIANMPDNTLTLTLTMTGSITANTNISLIDSISADAILYNNTIPHNYYLNFDTSGLTDLTATLNSDHSSLVSVSGTAFVTKTGDTSTPIFFNKDNLVPVKIGNITIEPSDTSKDVIDTSGFGLQFGNLSATATEVQLDKSPVTFEVTSATYGTADDKFKNYLKKIIADVYVKPFYDIKGFSGTNVPGIAEVESGFTVKLKGKAFRVPDITNKLIRLDHGTNIIARRGEQRTITVFGDIGASFKYTVRKTDDIHNRVYAKLSGTTTDINDLTATIQPTSKTTKGQGSFSFTAEFDSVPTTTKYDLIIDADTGTTGLNGINGGSQTTLLYQYTNPRLKIILVGGKIFTLRNNINNTVTDPGASRSDNTEYIITGRPLAEGGSIPHIPKTSSFNAIFTFTHASSNIGGNGIPVFTESTEGVTGLASDNKTIATIDNITVERNARVGKLSFDVNISRWGTDGDTKFTSSDIDDIFKID